MKRTDDVVGILLAAGRSRRFGGDKLLHLLPDGTPMVLASLGVLRAALRRTVVVAREDNERLAALLSRHEVEVTMADDADTGMGASLAAGIAATADASGWVVALADMPFIRPHTVAQVASALNAGAGLAAPGYRGQRGHPVGFSARYRQRLLQLSGDEGARSVLQQFAHELVIVDSEDAGVLIDIDR